MIKGIEGINYNVKNFHSVLIAGVSGQFGTYLANLFLESGKQVIGLSRSAPDITHENFNFLQCDCCGKLSEDVKKTLQSVDIVLISLPIHKTIDGIKNIAPHLKQGQIMTDVTSVKELPCAAMLEHTTDDVEVLGMHPMFSPSLDIKGKNVILTKERIREDSAQMLFDFWKEKQAQVAFLTAKEHDNVVAVLQSLSHFVTMAFGKALKDLHWDFDKNKPYETTYFKLLSSLLGRVMQFDSHLYAYIQLSNPEGHSVIQQFLQSAQELKDEIDQGDATSLLKEMQSIEEYLPKQKNILTTTNAMYRVLQENTDAK